MSLCGCYPACSCQLTVGTPELLSLIGNGDPGTGGWTLSAIETVFAASAIDNAISITPGGTYGHGPSFGLNVDDTDTVDLSIGPTGLVADVRIDPDSTAPVSVGPDGLKIDCCAEGGVDVGVDDTYSIDMDLTGAVITAGLIADPDGALDITATGVSVLENASSGIEVTASGVAIKLEDDPAAAAPAGDNLARFTTIGDLTVSKANVLSQLSGDIVSLARENSGINLTGVSSGVQVSFNGTAGNASSNSISVTNTNGGTETLVMVIEGTGEIVVEYVGDAATLTNYFQVSAVLEATALSGGATQISGAGIHTYGAFYRANDSGEVIPSSLSERSRGLLRAAFVMPPGSSVTWRSRAETLESFVGFRTTVANGSWYQFNNIRRYVFAEKEGAAWGIV